MKIFFVVLAIVLGLVTILFGLQLFGVALFVRLVIAILWIAPCWMKVEPYQGVVVAILGVPWRSCGAGPKFIFRPFGIPIESVVREAKIERFPLSFDMNADTYNEEDKDRDVVPVSIAVNGEVKANALISYFKFESDPKKREGGLIDRIKGLVTIEVFKYKSCDEVYRKSKEIGKAITWAFQHPGAGELDLQEYFGVTMDEIAVSNIELTDELKQAQEDKEIAQEEAAAATVKMENFEKRVVMAQGTGRGKLSREKAINTVLTFDGKRKVEEKTVEIGKNFHDVINKGGNKVAKAVEGFLEYLNPKEKGDS